MGHGLVLLCVSMLLLLSRARARTRARARARASTALDFGWYWMSGESWLVVHHSQISRLGIQCLYNYNNNKGTGCPARGDV